jgi:hypothetical protein
MAAYGQPCSFCGCTACAGCASGQLPGHWVLPVTAFPNGICTDCNVFSGLVLAGNAGRTRWDSGTFSWCGGTGEAVLTCTGNTMVLTITLNSVVEVTYTSATGPNCDDCNTFMPVVSLAGCSWPATLSVCPQGGSGSLMLPRPGDDLMPSAPPGPGPALLGDVVKEALWMIGLTEDKVTAWLGRPCGCEGRREKLNDLDAWARGVLAERAGIAAVRDTMRGLLKRLLG